MDYSITNPKNFLTTPWQFPAALSFMHPIFRQRPPNTCEAAARLSY